MKNDLNTYIEKFIPTVQFAKNYHKHLIDPELAKRVYVIYSKYDLNITFFIYSLVLIIFFFSRNQVTAYGQPFQYMPSHLQAKFKLEVERRHLNLTVEENQLKKCGQNAQNPYRKEQADMLKKLHNNKLKPELHRSMALLLLLNERLKLKVIKGLCPWDESREEQKRWA
jgi:hypothetical protein